MKKTWANSGIDLHVELAGSRVRAALENALRDAVRAGRLRAGTRLPSSRALAADLGIARNTVADAYDQLVAEGWLTARTGSGTWVADRRVPAVQPDGPAPPEVTFHRYDLRPGVPELTAFPRREWLATARNVVNAAPAHLFGYPDPRGLPQLRLALAAYLARARGVTADPGRIVICAGFAHGLALLCQVLRARGATTIAMEAYGHQAHRRLAEAQGLGLALLPVDAGGAVLGGGDVRGGLSEADAAVLTPAHQFPLGVTLEPRRRRAAVQWATSTGGLVIEDDYDGEFRYDRQPVGAMQALAPDHVVYAGTASKSLAPGLRLGWLVLPAGLFDDVVAAKKSSGMASSSLEQLTLAEFFTSGAYDRQVRHARLAYRRRRDRMVSAFHEHAPQVRVTGIAAGLHALLRLPETCGEADIVTRASSRGLAVEGLASYSAAGNSDSPASSGQCPAGPGRNPAGPGPVHTGDADRHGPALVIGYGRPADHAFTTALARLCAVLSEVGH